MNLDVCGFGDTIAICGKGNENKPVFRPFCQKLLLDRYNAQVLKYLPKKMCIRDRGSGRQQVGAVPDRGNRDWGLHPH